MCEENFLGNFSYMKQFIFLKKGLKVDLLFLVYEKGLKDFGIGMGDNDRLIFIGKVNI